MKRTLGIIFTLLMIMVAFVACEMVEEGDPLPTTENTETTPVGTVTIKQYKEGEEAKSTYCVGKAIYGQHFWITLRESNGRLLQGNAVPSGVKIQYSTTENGNWTDITAGTTTYPKEGALWIKAYHKNYPELGDTIKITVYASQASDSSAE